MNLKAYITDVLPGEGVTMFAPLADTYLVEKRQITEAEVRLDDGRTISARQRNKIFALVGDISRYVSGLDKHKRSEIENLRALQLCYLIDAADSEQVRRQLTYNYCQLCNIDMFSLSERSSCTIDMTTARDFIDWLVELCIANGIPCIDTLLNRCEDIGRYLYACLIHKKCALCGGKAELHHVDAVGAGRNRKEILHLGMRALPLCRNHHNEIHNIGRDTFCEKYHVHGIKLDEELCGIWKLKAA